MDGLRLKRPPLPKELINRHMDLYRLVTIAGDMNQNDQDRPEVVKTTRAFLRRACHSYKPSAGPDFMACRSGETNGRPFRGEACSTCIVGQWSRNMVFIGEIRPAQPQVQ